MVTKGASFKTYSKISNYKDSIKRPKPDAAHREIYIQIAQRLRESLGRTCLCRGKHDLSGRGLQHFNNNQIVLLSCY